MFLVSGFHYFILHSEAANGGLLQNRCSYKLLHGYFLVNFAKFSKAPSFPTEKQQCLLLQINAYLQINQIKTNCLPSWQLHVQS